MGLSLATLCGVYVGLAIQRYVIARALRADRPILCALLWTLPRRR